MYKNIFDYVEYRLVIWCKWYSYSKDNGLGYPGTNILMRVKEMGGHYIKATGPKPLPCNDDADEIEAMVREMHQQDPKMALALRHHYNTDGDVMGDKLVMSYSQRMVHVNRARAWLAGRLSMKTK